MMDGLRFRIVIVVILSVCGIWNLDEITHWGRHMTSSTSNSTYKPVITTKTTGSAYSTSTSISTSISTIQQDEPDPSNHINSNQKNYHPYTPIDPQDYIVSQHLGASPIVVERYKLIFFYVPKVGCTVWKQLFRRMMGYTDWKEKFPHDTRSNGLVYLHQLNLTYATEIMNSPDYTRAIMLRDPKERLLSAYLDKALHDQGSYLLDACCKSTRTCWTPTITGGGGTFADFFRLTQRCMDTHWRPQSQRMEEKYIPLLDVIGHMKTMERDAKRLLQRIGAWDDYGASGWGVHGNESIFQSKGTVSHATSQNKADSRQRLAQFYTAELEKIVDLKYAKDYDIPEYRLWKQPIFPSSRPTVHVQRKDYIMSSRFGAAPIVVERFKLIFFYVPKVACTVWKKLFRRMMGYDDWSTKYPHSRTNNGLVYLDEYNTSYASHIMNSPDYTRVIFLRDPKERFLSAYLDKALHDNATYVVHSCCKTDKRCWKPAQTLEGFFQVTRWCEDVHWRPQSRRMDDKYIQLLDYVGHMDTIQQDAKELLEMLGTWEDFGQSGWGLYGNESIFQSTSAVSHATSDGATDSWSRLARYYTPEIERLVEKKYRYDYKTPEFHLVRKAIDFTHDETTRISLENNQGA